MGKYNSGKNGKSAKLNTRSLIAEIAALIAIVILIVTLVLVGANKGGTKTSIFALERDTYVLDGDYTISELDFDAIGSTENNLRLNHACCIDLNGYELDLNGYSLSIIPTRLVGTVTIKNGKIKNGTLLVDNDDNDLTIDGVSFDSTLKYTFITSGSVMTLSATAVQSRNIKATGGTLNLENAKIDDITLYSNLNAEGSTIGVITSNINGLTLAANNCSIAGVKVSGSTTFIGNFDCDVEIVKEASASADENKNPSIIIKNSVSALNVNANADVKLMRDGENPSGATVNTLNVNANADNSKITVMNCATVGEFNLYSNASIDISGAVSNLKILGKSTAIVQKSAIINNLSIIGDATVDIYGSVYYTQIEGCITTSFNSSANILRIDIYDASQEANININCDGAALVVHSNRPQIFIQRDCKIRLIIDDAQATASNINFLIERNLLIYGKNVTDEDIEREINNFLIPISYVDSTCTGNGSIYRALGGKSGFAEGEPLKSIGHKYEYYVIEKATEDHEGKGKRVCSVCGVEYEYTIAQDKPIYDPKTPIDYLALLFGPGEHDYSLQDNSGYILNYVEDEGQSSAEGDTGVFYDVLYFKTCYIHVNVEQNKNARTVRLFGDVDIDATLLKKYNETPDWNNIDDTKAAEAINFKLTVALKDSVVAFKYDGPEFLFLKPNEFFMDVNDLIDGFLHMIPVIPESFGTEDVIELIETCRKVIYYFQKYGEPFEFLLEALLNRVNLSAMVPGISWIAKADEERTQEMVEKGLIENAEEETGYYLSLEQLAQSIIKFKDMTLNDYIDDIFGRGSVSSILNYAYKLPNETMADIKSSLETIAGMFGGMDLEALIEDFNILISILLKNVAREMPSDSDIIKENIEKYFGRTIDISRAFEEYSDYTIYELVYGRFVADPDSEDPIGDYQRYLDLKNEFDHAWSNTVDTLDTVSLNTSIGVLIDSLLETFEAYIDTLTLESVLAKMVELEQYFSYEWSEDGDGNKLNSEFNLYVPDGIEYIVLDLAQNGPSYAQAWLMYVKETILRLTGVSTADEEENEDDEYELLNIFNFKYNNKDGYFEKFSFDWLLFDSVEVSVEIPELNGIKEVVKEIETTKGIEFDTYYYNTFAINIYTPGEEEGEDLKILSFNFDEETYKISNLDANIIIAEGIYFTYHDYPEFIECGLGIAPISGAELKLNVDKGTLFDEEFVIEEDATPTSVVYDALMLLNKVTLTLALNVDDISKTIGELSFNSAETEEDKHFIRLNTIEGFEIASCIEYDIWFDEESIYLEGYKNYGLNNQTYYHYGIINDEFVKNSDGKIIGLEFVVYEKYYKDYGGGCAFADDYIFKKIGISIEDSIKINFVDYDDVYTDYSFEKLNDSYSSSSRTVVIDDEVYVHSAELNSDFRPDSESENKWRQYWSKIGDIDSGRVATQDVKYIFDNAANVNFFVEGEIDYNFKANNKISANFDVEYLEWAHYTQPDEDDYNVEIFNSYYTDIEGELVVNFEKVAPDPDDEDQRYRYKFVDGKFMYYRYDTRYDTGKEERYKNWGKVENEDNYEFLTYQREGGEVTYDAETDVLYGKIIEREWIDHWDGMNYYSEIVSRTAYELLDEKYDEGRRFKFVRYHYDNDETPFTVTSTEIYAILDVIFGGNEQDALQLTFGSKWLSAVQEALYKVGIRSSYSSTAEIRAKEITETYQILLYKDEITGKYNGIAISIADFEVAFVVDRDEIMLKLDLRRFDFPINIDIDIVFGDIEQLSFVVQYGERGDEEVDINIVSDHEDLEGYIAVYGIKYFTAYRNNETGEWDYRLMYPIIDDEKSYDPDEDYPYYAFSFIYKDEDIDLLWGVFNRGKPEEEKNWLDRLLDIADHRDIIKINYDRFSKILKVDFTVLQIGPVSINVNLVISDTYYEYCFNLIGVLNDDYQYSTAGKESIEVLNFLKITGNHKTGAFSVFVTELGAFADEEIAVRFMYDPFGDNGFSVFRLNEDVFDAYNGEDDFVNMEYITVVYNLNDYTLRVVLPNLFEAIVEIDEDDPTIRNAHLYISVINLERDFQITELEDGRIMAVSNIWNNAMGIYEPSTFVITFTTTEIEGYKEINANIEKGLGTGAYYVGQIDYKDDGSRQTVFFTIVTQLKIVSNVEIYTVESENVDEDGNNYKDTFIYIPFTYEGDGMYYDFHLKVRESQDPLARIFNEGTDEEMTVEQFIDKFLEEMRAKYESGADDDEK